MQEAGVRPPLEPPLMSQTDTLPGPASLTPTRYAWMVVAMLVPVALLNYMDRQMLAAMKTSVMR